MLTPSSSLPALRARERILLLGRGPAELDALGVLLHELLSGDVPFAGSTALGVLHRHLYEPPLPVRKTRPEVPAALEALVLRLLAKDPQDRPASAQEVYEDLAPLLPKHGTPAGPLDPTRPFLRPHAPWPDRAATPALMASAAKWSSRRTSACRTPATWLTASYASATIRNAKFGAQKYVGNRSRT